MSNEKNLPLVLHVDPNSRGEETRPAEAVTVWTSLRKAVNLQELAESIGPETAAEVKDVEGDVGFCYSDSARWSKLAAVFRCVLRVGVFRNGSFENVVAYYPDGTMFG